MNICTLSIGRRLVVSFGCFVDIDITNTLNFDGLHSKDIGRAKDKLDLSSVCRSGFFVH